ncbi:hypothetical protein HK099_004577 [Clydaea vesicula]|uniref:Uncharacterized protein n=1 Tax=Clydaea vesicula TaxID=447962 RepID=A0AAD5Y069_9FUNG|nr:hypothetical protein HK099_004577 [Clydaea vesicula]
MIATNVTYPVNMIASELYMLLRAIDNLTLFSLHLKANYTFDLLGYKYYSYKYELDKYISTFNMKTKNNYKEVERCVIIRRRSSKNNDLISKSMTPTLQDIEALALEYDSWIFMSTVSEINEIISRKSIFIYSRAIFSICEGPYSKTFTLVGSKNATHLFDLSRDFHEGKVNFFDASLRISRVSQNWCRECKLCRDTSNLMSLDVSRISLLSDICIFTGNISIDENATILAIDPKRLEIANEEISDRISTDLTNRWIGLPTIPNGFNVKDIYIILLSSVSYTMNPDTVYWDKSSNETYASMWRILHRIAAQMRDSSPSLISLIAGRSASAYLNSRNSLLKHINLHDSIVNQIPSIEKYISELKQSFIQNKDNNSVRSLVRHPLSINNIDSSNELLLDSSDEDSCESLLESESSESSNTEELLDWTSDEEINNDLVYKKVEDSKVINKSIHLKARIYSQHAEYCNVTSRDSSPSLAFRTYEEPMSIPAPPKRVNKAPITSRSDDMASSSFDVVDSLASKSSEPYISSISEQFSELAIIREEMKSVLSLRSDHLSIAASLNKINDRLSDLEREVRNIRLEKQNQRFEEPVRFINLHGIKDTSVENDDESFEEHYEDDEDSFDNVSLRRSSTYNNERNVYSSNSTYNAFDDKPTSSKSSSPRYQASEFQDSNLSKENIVSSSYRQFYKSRYDVFARIIVGILDTIQRDVENIPGNKKSFNSSPVNSYEKIKRMCSTISKSDQSYNIEVPEMKDPNMVRLMQSLTISHKQDVLCIDAGTIKSLSDMKSFSSIYRTLIELWIRLKMFPEAFNAPMNDIITNLGINLIRKVKPGSINTSNVVDDQAYEFDIDIRTISKRIQKDYELAASSLTIKQIPEYVSKRVDKKSIGESLPQNAQMLGSKTSSKIGHTTYFKDIKLSDKGSIPFTPRLRIKKVVNDKV